MVWRWFGVKWWCVSAVSDVARSEIGLGETRFLLVLTLRFSNAFDVLSPQDVSVFSSYYEPAAPFLKYPN